MSDDKKQSTPSTDEAINQVDTKKAKAENTAQKKSVKTSSTKKSTAPEQKSSAAEKNSKKRQPTKQKSETKKSPDIGLGKKGENASNTLDSQKSVSAEETREKAKVLKERLQSSLSSTRAKAKAGSTVKNTTVKADISSTKKEKNNDTTTQENKKTDGVIKNTSAKESTASKKKGASEKKKEAPIPTATNEAAKESAVWYDPLASSIFSKPIFNYPEEASKTSPNPVPPISDEPIEIRNESLEMLLDLQIDEDDAEIDLLEHHEAQTLDSFEFFTDIPSETNSFIEDAPPHIESETADSLTSLEESHSEASNETTDQQETEGTIEKILERDDEPNNSDSEVETETLENEIAISPEPELPPLMDIDHFFDYRSKNLTDDNTDLQLSLISDDAEDNPDISFTEDCLEEALPMTEPSEIKIQDNTDFQRSFFDEVKNAVPANDSVSHHNKKELTAEPLALPDEKTYDPQKPRKVDFRFDFVELFVFTLVIIMILTTFVFRHSIVDGSSMESTLQDGDHLIIYDLFYSPEPGDIIVFEDYSTEYRKPLVKRVIATEGQTVIIDIFGDIYVDDVKLSEEYVYIDGYDSITKPLVCTVPEGEVFVMGDHRNLSSDSRSFGTVRVDSILGKAVLRFFPFNKFGTIE